MYFAVGGRNTQSALYRVTYIGKESTAESKSDDRFAENRALRRKLESFHGRQDPKAVETVWPYLGDSDRAIRYAARIALEWQDASQWRERAIAENDPRKAIAAIVALARASGRDDYHRKASDPKPDAALQGEMLAALDRIDWSKLETGDRLDLIRTYELTLIRLGRPDDATCERLAAKFDALFPAQTKEFNIHLANMLVYLQAPSAAAKTMALLGSALTQEEQIEYVLALRALKTGWTMPLREDVFPLVQYQGRKLPRRQHVCGFVAHDQSGSRQDIDRRRARGAQAGSRSGARATVAGADARRPQARQGMVHERAGPAC